MRLVAIEEAMIYRAALMTPSRAQASPLVLNVQRLLVLSGWKKSDLARKAEVTPNTISLLFTKGTSDYGTLEKIARAFNVGMEELFWSERTRVILEEYGRRQAIVDELSGGRDRLAPAPSRRKRPMR